MAAKNSIVFPTDFSELSSAALPWALDMARTLNADIHCLYVVEEPQIYASLDMGPMPVPSTEELTATAKTRLDQFVASHFGSGKATAVPKVRVGRPADEIVAYAKESGARLIVMPTHGYSGVKHVLLGSTTESVLRHASCPVLSVRSR